MRAGSTRTPAFREVLLAPAAGDSRTLGARPVLMCVPPAAADRVRRRSMVKNRAFPPLAARIRVLVAAAEVGERNTRRPKQSPPAVPEGAAVAELAPMARAAWAARCRKR